MVVIDDGSSPNLFVINGIKQTHIVMHWVELARTPWWETGLVLHSFNKAGKRGNSYTLSGTFSRICKYKVYNEIP